MTLKYNGIYRGKVLATDVSESDNVGRLKVEVYSMLVGEDTARDLAKTGTSIVGIATADLPWAKPAYPIFSGSGSGFGFFAVPEVDSFVFIFFEDGDIYQPVYFAEAPTATLGIPSSSQTNYPNRRVLKTKTGLEVIFDDQDESIKINHPTGSLITMDSDGSISITGNGEVNVTGGGDVNITGSSDIDIEGNGVVTISGSTVEINT